MDKTERTEERINKLVRPIVNAHCSIEGNKGDKNETKTIDEIKIPDKSCVKPKSDNNVQVQPNQGANQPVRTGHSSKKRKRVHCETQQDHYNSSNSQLHANNVDANDAIRKRRKHCLSEDQFNNKDVNPLSAIDSTHTPKTSHTTLEWRSSRHEIGLDRTSRGNSNKLDYKIWNERLHQQKIPTPLKDSNLWKKASLKDCYESVEIASVEDDLNVATSHHNSIVETHSRDDLLLPARRLSFGSTSQTNANAIDDCDQWEQLALVQGANFFCFVSLLSPEKIKQMSCNIDMLVPDLVVEDEFVYADARSNACPQLSSNSCNRIRTQSAVRFEQKSGKHKCKDSFEINIAHSPTLSSNHPNHKDVLSWSLNETKHSVQDSLNTFNATNELSPKIGKAFRSNYSSSKKLSPSDLNHHAPTFQNTIIQSDSKVSERATSTFLHTQLTKQKHNANQFNHKKT
ncbi:hypothetical protein RFI_03227 [Reticulomyxa filosa]|uniref:Uncharacterized protein n=1 Tax=Reticulomyxa filosa TaxID=46433 RepID=X6P8C5_RETFI|nr:hypothetical protein RFI_03227 [Reticulomyxa filosa]|eukprot:ETO33867.1 hypothetical protein RFI_03227 [Reticulomyxa filosa]